MTALIAVAATGCPRSAPPEVPTFRPPPAREVEEIIVPELVETEAPPPAPPRPEPEKAPEKKPEPKVAEAPAAPEGKPEIKPEAPAAPTIVGTWRVVKMSRGGDETPVEQMQMTFTFTADGTATMSVTGGPEGQTMSRDGTYSLNGDQITISIEGDAKTGTCTFEGNDRVKLEVDEATLEMVRS